MTNTTERHRPLHEIAREIRADWTKIYFGARPYLDALGELDQIGDRYFYDTADDIVIRFLSNASSWRGETARRVKAELRELVK